MTLQVGRLETCGLAKEVVVGTLVTPPTEYLRFIPPDSFYPKASPLIEKAVGTLPDVNLKQTPGPNELTGMKLKLDAEPENIGNILMGAFGTDTCAEATSFVISASNHSINFKENGAAERTGTIATGTYAMGTTSATVGSLCAAVKTAMDSAAGASFTYTVTYSYTTKKMTIATSGTTVQILWLTGTNQATAAYTVLGWTHADTADAATVTSNSTTTVPVFTHTFTRLAAAQLPTYSFWFLKNILYPQFAGCMVNKMDLEIKAKELVSLDVDYTGLTYDASGSSHSPTYSPVRPFVFQNAVVTVDGSPVTGYDHIKLSINNMVKADHALNASQYPSKIYSEGFDVDFSAELFFDDATQYNKFLAGTTAAFSVVLTHIDDISGAASGQKYTLTLTLPTVIYTSANLVIPTGVLKLPFVGKAMYDTNTTESLQVVLKNSVSTAY